MAPLRISAALRPPAHLKDLASGPAGDTSTPHRVSNDPAARTGTQTTNTGATAQRLRSGSRAKIVGTRRKQVAIGFLPGRRWRDGSFPEQYSEEEAIGMRTSYSRGAAPREMRSGCDFSSVQPRTPPPPGSKPIAHFVCGRRGEGGGTSISVSTFAVALAPAG